MKSKAYITGLICVLVVLLFLFGDKLPEFLRNLLVPGFFLAAMINGSFHDRIIPAYMVLGVFFNCILYTAMVLLCTHLFRKLRSRN